MIIEVWLGLAAASLPPLARRAPTLMKLCVDLYGGAKRGDSGRFVQRCRNSLFLGFVNCHVISIFWINLSIVRLRLFFDFMKLRATAQCCNDPKIWEIECIIISQVEM